MRCSALIIVACFAAGPLAAADAAPGTDRVAAARAVFEKYVALEHAFDPTLADMYADTAVIRNKRTYPSGNVRDVSFPAPQYKALIRKAMPQARAHKDVSTYSKVNAVAEGDAVRITASRFSELKQYSSPLSLLLRKGDNGRWLIVEELSESRP